MARYIGPTSKISRRFQQPIFGPCKQLTSKNYAPGQHGRGKKRKSSEYSTQLSEKQKVRYTYGLLERQFRKFFEKASRMKGVTGSNLLQLLEARLDNTVYRLGIARTRRGARQLVTHKHIIVNDVLVNIPSYVLRPGDVITLTEDCKNFEFVKTNLSARQSRYNWLQWDNSNLKGVFLTMPERQEIPETFNEQLIVELYSK